MELRRDQKRLRNQGKYLGIGVSTYVEICAMGPKGMWEYGKVQVEPDGKVTVLSGASPHGQGRRRPSRRSLPMSWGSSWMISR